METTDIQSRLQQKLANYKPSDATVALIKNTPILLFVGISGAGKGTILSQLLEGGHYHLIVSHTTRAPRLNNGVMEQDGREYHFIDLAEAERMLDSGAYVEAAMYAGNVYGTSAAEIQAAHDAGQVAAADIEVQGVANYMKIDPNVRAIFILPPSYGVWQERFLKRYAGGTVDEADVQKRTATAARELENALSAPYFQFVINDGLAQAVEDAKRIAGGEAQDEQARAAARRVAGQLLHDIRAHAAPLPQAA